jgi:hypothetical protein
VIDLIDDDPDGACDFDEPELNWADCPILPCSDIFALIERHGVLDGRAVNLFRNALKGQPRSDLLESASVPPGAYYNVNDPRPEPIRAKNPQLPQHILFTDLINWITKSSNTTKFNKIHELVNSRGCPKY